MQTVNANGRIVSRVLRAGVAVGVAHVLFKVMGLVQAIVVGRYVDGGTYDVVYAFGFEGCIFSLFLFGEESIAPAFLPVFMREFDTKGERCAWRFANTVLTVQFLLLLVAVALLMLFPGQVVRLMTNWTAEGDSKRFSLACGSLVWLAPSLVGLSLGTTTYMLLNGYKRFFLAALGDATWKLCVVLAVVVGIGFLGLDYRVLLAGLVVGSVGKLGTHAVGLGRRLRFLRPTVSFRNPAFRQMLALMLPLMVGIVFARVRDIYGNVTVLSHLETEGLMQANSFGRKLYVAFGWLVPYAFSIAMFPFLCELVDRGDREKFGRLVVSAGRMMLSVFIPLSLICAVLSRPIASLLFQGGEFTEEAVGRTAVSTACYILVLPGYALEYLLMQALFANRRMWSVTILGIVFSLVAIGINYAGIVLCGARGTVALAVIGLGYALSRTSKAVALMGLLRRHIPRFSLRDMSAFLARAFLTGIAAAMVAAGAAWAFDTYVSSSTTKAILLAKLTLSAGAGFGVFLGTAILVRLEEPGIMLRWTFERLRLRLAPARP